MGCRYWSIVWDRADRPNGVIGRGKGRYGRHEVAKEKFRVVGTGVLSRKGQSGERSWAGGMFTND